MQPDTILLSHAPYTFNPAPYTFNPAPYTFNPAPYTFNPAPCCKGSHSMPPLSSILRLMVQTIAA